MSVTIRTPSEAGLIAWRCECHEAPVPREHLECVVAIDTEIRDRLTGVEAAAYQDACSRGAAPDTDPDADGWRVLRLIDIDPEELL